MRQLLLATVLVAGAAQALPLQTFAIYDDSFENGFTSTPGGTDFQQVTTPNLCAEGSCLVTAFVDSTSVVTLINVMHPIDFMRADGIQLSARGLNGDTTVTFQLSSLGDPVGNAQSYSLTSDYGSLFLSMSSFGAVTADGLRVSGDMTGLVLDDITVVGDPGLTGTGGGAGGGGGSGGGNDLCRGCAFPGCCPTGGGSGQFGGGADLGCNCDSATPVSNVMLAFYGVMVSFHLRRRRR